MTQPVRQPDTYVTVTRVSVVPVTSVVVNTRFEPRVVTETSQVARTLTKTQATTQLVPVRSTVVRQVLRTVVDTDVVYNTQQVVQTRVQDAVQTVRLPSQPRVIVQTEQVVVSRTVQQPDTFRTQYVTVAVPREVVNTRVVEQVQRQEKIVTQTRGGGYCKQQTGYGHSYGKK